MASKIRKARATGNPILRRLVQPLYDTTVVAGAVATGLLQFFRIQQGGIMPVAAVVKSEADTNMKTAGALGEPMMFDLESFNFEWFVLEPDDVDDTSPDLVDIYEQSLFTFLFGLNRTAWQFPLSQIPSGTMLTGQSSSGDTTNATEWGFLHQGVPSVGQVYDVMMDNEPTEIGPVEPFGIDITWPNGNFTTTSTNNQRARVFMNGCLYTQL